MYTPHESDTCVTTPTETTIGIVNLMPEAAAVATERQYRRLISAGTNENSTSIKIFSNQNLWSPAEHINQQYASLESLFDTRIDGLIVTGAVPQARKISDEKNWPLMMDIIDWAAENTVSTIWSCFSAHAAAYGIDRINREPVHPKISGVFNFTRVSTHPIVSQTATNWSIPHSRKNTISECALKDHGYTILSTGSAGVDSFLKTYKKSEFVFFHGHPEYSEYTLLSEYRRDIEASLTSPDATYPEIPENVVDSKTALQFHDLREQIAQNTLENPMAAYDHIEKTMLGDRWRPLAECLFSSWITYIDKFKTTRTFQSS